MSHGHDRKRCCEFLSCPGEAKRKMLLCSGCKLFYYCSSQCQKADWKKHKLECKAYEGFLKNLGDPEKFKRNKGQRRQLKCIAERLCQEAEKGDAQTQYNAAFCLEQGFGVKHDQKKALKYYLMAANQGHAQAQCNAAYSLMQGIGGAQDVEKSLVYYFMAAEQGFALAQINLASLFAVTDQNISLKFYKRAAAQGDPVGQINLGFFFAHGLGVAQDLEKALKYYTLAAAKFAAPNFAWKKSFASLSLGTDFGVAPDLTTCVKYYDLALASGHLRAQFYLSLIFLHSIYIC